MEEGSQVANLISHLGYMGKGLFIVIIALGLGLFIDFCS
jgi:hypothetical protein